ncbi:MAG TPA: GNAT family protein [Kofleriaceae bacterium]|nr:GNAT family protein [Kofleriaceae bacterium]
MVEPAPHAAYRIETARMVLRCWSPVDAAALKTSIDGCLVSLQRWLPWAARHPLPLDEVMSDLRAMRRRFDADEDFAYGAFDPAEAEVVGGGGLHMRAGPDARELGYWIHAERAGTGLATELGAALCRVAFEIDRVQRIDLRCHTDNGASARVAEKLGFVHEGVQRRRLKSRTGELRDGMLWTMLRDEFSASPAASLAAGIRAHDAADRRIL